MKRILVLLLSVILIIGCSLTTYADVASGSNAVMLMSLDDDYGISTLSSIGTVTNTIDASDVQFYVYYNDASAGVDNVLKYGNITYSGGRFHYSIVLDTDDEIVSYGFQIKSGSLPSPGDYTFSFDVSSDFSFDYNRVNLYFVHQNKNASNQTATKLIYPDTFSGDAYLAPMEMRLNSLYRMNLTFYIDSPLGDAVGGDIAFNFTVADIGSDAYVTPGSNTSSEDYQSGVSSSLSDMSSSMSEQADAIEGVADAIENLQASMEPHYNNVLTQLHHITEQLHAFYDQVYNNIHLAQMNLLDQIKTAIENIDLEVNVNLDKLKTSIDNMSTAIQNKLQSVTDKITGGYDNSGMQSENEELSGAVNELDQAEKEVLDDVTGYIEDFEYPSFDSFSGGIVAALSFFGALLQNVFLGMGDFGLIITFSLTMIFVMIIVGYHRIRG